MTARRTLTLRRETLSDLTARDLAAVAGAAATGITCPLIGCALPDISEGISCNPSCGHSGCCSLDMC